MGKLIMRSAVIVACGLGGMVFGGNPHPRGGPDNQTGRVKRHRCSRGDRFPHPARRSTRSGLQAPSMRILTARVASRLAIRTSWLSTTLPATSSPLRGSPELNLITARNTRPDSDESGRGCRDSALNRPCPRLKTEVGFCLLHSAFRQLAHVKSAVHVEDVTGDIGRHWRGEK